MHLYLRNIGDIYGNVPVTQSDTLLPNPDVLAADIIENLQSVRDSFNNLISVLKK